MNMKGMIDPIFNISVPQRFKEEFINESDLLTYFS